jgi:hypothetical protein
MCESDTRCVSLTQAVTTKAHKKQKDCPLTLVKAKDLVAHHQSMDIMVDH